MELFIATKSLKRINDFVDGTFQNKDPSIIHAQPDVLLIVNSHVQDSVVQVRYVTSCTCLVIIEMVSIEP